MLVALEGDNNTIDLPEKLARIDAAFDAGAAAVIAVCDHPSGRVQFGNVADDRAPWRGPLVLVGRADAVRLRASVGSTATLTLEGEMRTVVAENVQDVSRAGRSGSSSRRRSRAGRPARASVVPASRSSARSPRWASSLESGPSWCFTSNSGYEFHNLGARVAHERGTLPKSEDTALWLHLGAAIGQRSWEERDPHGIELKREKSVSLASCDWRDTPSVLGHFWGTTTLVWPQQLWKVGELIEVVGHGYPRALGLVARRPPSPRARRLSGDDEFRDPRIDGSRDLRDRRRSRPSRGAR